MNFHQHSNFFLQENAGVGWGVGWGMGWGGGGQGSGGRGVNEKLCKFNKMHIFWCASSISLAQRERKDCWPWQHFKAQFIHQFIVNSNFWSRFANDFPEWCCDEWKAFASRFRSSQQSLFMVSHATFDFYTLFHSMIFLYLKAFVCNAMISISLSGSQPKYSTIKVSRHFNMCNIRASYQFRR